jgi:redox-sensitive bicupin YhaK (pirin superfamily)
MSVNPVIRVSELVMPWATQDPFLFCAYHRDLYPAGNDELGPLTGVSGRNIGQDFAGKDGWSMYHGSKVPGFPAHPHRGFETVTIVKEGLVDHSDSLGCTGRFGSGDVQWLTSGKGVQHAEMFPLVSEKSNHLEMFQIWLNLPKKDKMVDPYYKMLWSEDIPIITKMDEAGNQTEITLVAGKLDDKLALDPTENSWANRPENEVQIWTLKMAPNARFVIPRSLGITGRSIYFYKGSSLFISGQEIMAKKRIELEYDQDVQIENGSQETHLLFLQGKPIGEPVAQYGPFVMNTHAEIQAAFDEYQNTQFGGWPWGSSAPTNEKGDGRFAQYADGTKEIR